MVWLGRALQGIFPTPLPLSQDAPRLPWVLWECQEADPGMGLSLRAQCPLLSDS